MIRLQRFAFFFALLLVSVAAAIACTGDEPDVIVAAPAGDSGGAGTSGSSGSPDSGTTSNGDSATPADAEVEAGCTDEPVTGAFCERVRDAAAFCTSFEDPQDAGYRLVVADGGAGRATRVTGGTTGEFAFSADSQTGGTNDRGGFIFWGQPGAVGNFVKQVIVHARIRPDFEPTPDAGAGVPIEGAVDLIRVRFTGGAGEAALRYAQRTRSRNGAGVSEVRGYFIEGASPNAGTFVSNSWGALPQPLKPGEWREVSFMVTPGTPTGGTAELFVFGRCAPQNASRLVSTDIPRGAAVSISVGNYADTAVTTANGHSFDDVWVEIMR